jgi:protein tonB
MYGNTPTDLFNGKSDSDVTLEEYLNGLETVGVLYPTDYVSASVETALPAGKAHPEWRTLHTHLVKSIFREENENNKLVDMIDNAATILDTNSPGLVTENTETFTYHDVITPLRAYRLNAGENVVRHIYKEVPKGSVIATYRDEAGNDLIDAKQVKTNESEGTAYNTQSETIAPRVTTETTPEGFTKTITKTYELIAEPQNKDGEVQGGKTITVPYVYNKKVTEVITPKPQPEKPKEDKSKEDKPKEETPKETPKPKEEPKETPKVEQPKPKESPKVEQPKETPKPKDEPKETPKEDEKPKGDTPKVEQPKEAPKENPKTEKPNVPIKEELPKTKEIPQTDKPKEDNSKEIPKKDSNPVNEPVKSQVQKTELPNTGAKQDSTGVLGLISLLLSGGLLTLKRRKNAE